MSSTEKPNRSREKYLRQRFLKLGIRGIMPRDAIELVLSYCLSGASLYTAVNALFEKYGSTQRILNAPYEELCKVAGMTENAASLICLLSGIYSVSSAMSEENRKITDSAVACEYFLQKFRGISVERFMICCLRDDFSAAKCCTVGRGSTYGVDVDIEEIISCAARSGCRLCIVAHNHPGGNCRPSAADIDSTRRLVSAFKDAGIELLDHIVTGRDGAQSVFDTDPFGSMTIQAKKY